MEIYRLRVRCTEEIPMACCGEFECYRRDENWIKETYYVGPKGLDSARKEFDLARENVCEYRFAHMAILEECAINNDGIIYSVRRISEIFKIGNEWIFAKV